MNAFASFVFGAAVVVAMVQIWVIVDELERGEEEVMMSEKTIRSVPFICLQNSAATGHHQLAVACAAAVR